MHKYIFIIIILIVSGPFQSIAADKIISNYKETLRLTDTGDTHISVEILISSYPDSVIEIPLNFDRIKNLNTSLEYMDKSFEDEAIPVQYYKTSANSFVRFDYAQTKGKELSLKMDFLTPKYVKFDELGPGEFDSYNWSYRFTNLSQFNIKKYSTRIILPIGYNFHKVTESSPKFTKKNPAPPYKFETIEEENQLTISASNLYFGDIVFIDFIFKSSHKSIWIILGGGILIALYLFFFREVWKNAQKK